LITPLLHRILVKPEKFEDFSKDAQRAKNIGLVIPEMEEKKRAQASVDRGTVVALGATAYRDYNVEPPVKVGDVVNYAKFSGKLIEDPSTEEQFVCLNDEDLICVLKDSHE
jgi:co-chaperonin GroES (HSP10)